MLFQAHEVGARQPARQPLDHQPFQAAADIEHVVRLVEARMRDRRTAVEMQFDQALGREPRERRAHHGAADPEALADQILGQLGSGTQRLLDDRAAQPAIDRFGARHLAVGAARACAHRPLAFRRLAASSAWHGSLSCLSDALSNRIVYDIVWLTYTK